MNSQEGGGVVYFDAVAGRLARAEFHYKVSLGFTRPVPFGQKLNIGIQLVVEEEKENHNHAGEAEKTSTGPR